MNITEMGLYKTRNNQKVEVTSIIPEIDLFSVKGKFIRLHAHEAIPPASSWQENGQFLPGANRESGMDLVAPWTDADEAEFNKPELEVDGIIDGHFAEVAEANQQAATAEIPSATDDSVIINTNGNENREITDLEKNFLQEVQNLGDAFSGYISALELAMGGCRELAIAKTRIEESVMWACKAITK